MKKLKLLGLLFLSFASFSQQQQPGKSFTEKLEGISSSKMELTKNASTDNTSIGQGGTMTNSIPLVTVSSRTMSFPLQLQYASGIKVDQRSGSVGLGWVLPIGSITRDFGAYYPDYSSTQNESQMLNMVDMNLPTSDNTGKFNTWYINGNDTVRGTYFDPSVYQKYLGFGTITDGLNNMPLSDKYHISVPGKLSNTFFNGAGINENHFWKLTDIENWKITHKVKNYKIPQEFSRINEINLTRNINGDPDLASSYASAIGVLPYVENGFARIALANTSFSPTDADSYVRYDDFEQFIITDDKGTRYVFGRALRGQRYVFSDDPFWSNSKGYDGGSLLADKGSFWKIDFIAEWLLTEIQSVDYVDANGNGIADDGDSGDWIRFQYTDPVKTEPSYLGGSCVWKDQTVPKYREWSSYSQTDRASSLMREQAYLQKIITPTQEIDFTISERYDVEHDYYTKPANRVGNDYYYENRKLCSTSSISDFDINYPIETMKYDSIKIKSRLVDSKLYPAESIQGGLIKFKYAAKGSSQELAVSNYLIRNNDKQEKVISGTLVGSPSRTAPFSIEDYKGTDKRGKTTLLGLEFYGTTVSSTQKTEYKFEYGYNPSFDEFHKREIVRAFYFPSVRQGHSSTNQIIPFSKADGLIQSYKEYSLNSSGLKDSVTRTLVSPYDFLIDFPYKEAEYKFNATTTEIHNYTSMFSSDQPYNLDTIYRIHGVNPIKDIYDYLYDPDYTNASSAWSLTKITYPTGGEVSFKYEPASYTQSSEWSIKPTSLPIITRYNQVAKTNSYIQDAYNREYAGGYNSTLFPKKLTSTFELDLPQNYGIRLKEKTSHDKINPVVTTRYEYDNGTFTALPAEFVQGAFSGFNQFIIRENHRHYIELGKYNLNVELSDKWDYDFAQKMSELSHTNIAIDDYSSIFFYKKIREKRADNSFIEKEYGSTLSENIQFPTYELYCTRIKGGSSWQGSYTLAGNNLYLSPISLKSEASFEANATTPYEKTSYLYERELDGTYYLKFDYNGVNPGAGRITLWDVEFNYYKPITSDPLNGIKKYDWLRKLSGDTVYTANSCFIGELANNPIEGNSISYIKWISSKTYLKKETTNYKGIVSDITYRYVKNAGTENKYVLRDITKQTVGESVKYITRNKYAFETYSGSTSKFRDKNLLTLPYQTTTYLNDTLDNKVLLSKVVTYDFTRPIPKVLDFYQYETAVDQATGTFTLPAFNISNPNWRVGESDSYEYNFTGRPVSTRSNRLYSKLVTGNRQSTIKASIIGTERPFDATYTGFEDFTDLQLIGKWNDTSYLREDWFTTEDQVIDIPAIIKSTNHLDVCDINHTSTQQGIGETLYLRISVNDVSNLRKGDQVTLTYTTVSNGNTYTTSPLEIEDIQPKSVTAYPGASDLNYYLCFTAAPLPNNLATTFTNAKITVQRPMSRLSNNYARTGKYSYWLASIRTSGAPSRKTPVRPVRIAPMTIATECNVPEGPGGGGEQGRDPNVPASCYWDYQASLWIKYDTDFPALPTPADPASTPFSDDPQADAIYRRGTVNTTTDQGVRIICKVWNDTKTTIREQFVFYPQDLNTAWQQFTIDFSIFKGYEQWVEVYVENNRNQVGAPFSQLRSAFVDDIIITPKESRYDYTVTNALGQETFKANNNDVFIQSTYDPKGRTSTKRDAYGNITQELTYFDQPNWTTTENYVTETKWVGSGLFNTTRYFMDGFGRTKQVQGSDHVRNLRMISETSIYNDKGQITRSYKPYYLNQYGLATKHDQTYVAKTQTLYGSNYAYNEVTFEPKPESVLATFSAPRTNAESPVISSQTEYMNTAVLTHTSSSGTTTFPIGTLMVHEMVNPVGKITRTYLNRLGQVIMEEHQIGMNHTQNTDGSISFTTADLGFAQTWFYYDGAGRIVSTYDPENKKTSYVYNSLGVMVRTTSADKGNTELRYDKYGQVRFMRSQNDVDATTANIYGTKQFRYIKYDAWGQSIESGVITSAPNNLGVSVTNPPFPTGDFFDDYTKINNQNYPANTDKFVQIHVKKEYTGTRKFYNSTMITTQHAYSGHILNTSTYVYSPTKTDQVNTTYMADGQVAKTNYLYDGLPGTHQITSVYNTMRQCIGKDYTHPTNSAMNFKWRSGIDNYGRTVTSSNIYNGNTTEVSHNFYDPMGNLLLSGLGATGVSNDPYVEYLSIKKNIREQVVSQMSKNLRIGLTYDLAGNITNQYWANEYAEPASATSTKINQYAYTYDKMNRLIGADYKQSILTSNPFQYYSTLYGNIPSDFACNLNEEVVFSTFNPHYAEFEKNIQDNIQAERSSASINALRQLQSDYVKNNIQYSDMTTTQIDDFLSSYIANCAKNRLRPTEFESYEAEKEGDLTHLDFLKNNPLQPASLKYMKGILSTIPWTQAVNCMPNPNATAYGYLQNFPTPVATENSNEYDAAYWYQKNGNFSTLNRNNNTGQRTQQLYSYQTNTNKLTQASFQVATGTPTLYNYTYDGNGNLASDPKNIINNITYSFFDDLPTVITKTNGGQSIYRYIGGSRISKKYSDIDEEFYIDQIVLDQTGSVKSYQTASGYAVIVGNKMQYHHQVKDWQGSTRLTLDNGGTIENATDYYPYGKKMPARIYYSTNMEGYRYGYTGHEADGETGYQYHGARYYEEDLARYMSVDPLAMEYQAWSTYCYVLANPVKLTDPTGKGVNDWVARTSTDSKGVKHKTWEWVNESYENEDEAKRAGKGYTDWMGKGGVRNNVHTNSGYVGPVTFRPDGTIKEGVESSPSEIEEVTITANRTSGGMSSKQVDAAFNPEQQIVIGTPQEALAGQISYQTQAHMNRMKRRWELDNLFNGLDNLTYYMFMTPYELIGLGEAFEGVKGIYYGYKYASSALARQSATRVVASSTDDVVESGTNVVYQGVDASGTVRYVGITNRAPIARFTEHLNSFGTGKEFLRYDVIKGADNLTRTQARVLEQNLINQFGLQRNGGLLLNRINSIAPKNWGTFGVTP